MSMTSHTHRVLKEMGSTSGSISMIPCKTGNPLPKINWPATCIHCSTVFSHTEKITERCLFCNKKQTEEGTDEKATN